LSPIRATYPAHLILLDLIILIILGEESFTYSLQIYFYSSFYPKAGLSIVIFCFQLITLLIRLVWTYIMNVSYYQNDQTWRSRVILFKRVAYCDFYKSQRLERRYERVERVGNTVPTKPSGYAQEIPLSDPYLYVWKGWNSRKKSRRNGLEG
jgi:hypothetical protein